MTTLLALSGSLRAGSFNTRILRALPVLAPAGVQIAEFDVPQIPLYNQDLDGEVVPEVIGALRSAVAEADGLIIASPEYNHTYSAVAKNFIDWASRPLMKGAILGKKSMIIAAGPGKGGGQHCLEALSGLLTMLGGTVVAKVGVAAAHEKVDPTRDAIVDEALAGELARGLAAFG